MKRPTKTRLAVLVAILAIGATAWIAVAVFARARPTTAEKTVPAHDAPDRARHDRVPIRSGREVVESRADRSSASVAAAPRSSFDELLARAVRQAVLVWDAIDHGDEREAQRLDAELRATFDALHRPPLEPEERALHLLLGRTDPPVPGDDGAARAARACRELLIRAVRQGLVDRAERARFAAEDRTALDAFVDTLLAALPQDEATATALGGMLVDAPYLGIGHETAVFELAELAQTHGWLVELTRELLTTLWRNLEASGATRPGSLASLALVLRDDANESRRLAALEHLLRTEDGRYRDFVVGEIVRERDQAAARLVAQCAADALDPPTAMAVLERLATLADADLTSAFVTLGQRDRGVLRQSYEQHLADATKPRLRAELVTGSSIEPTATGLAELAFANDPHPEVRLRALYALTAHGTESAAERAVTTLLDEPAFHSDALRLGAVGLALDNLAAAGHRHALARLGRRMLAASNLSATDRARIEKLLAENLPRGRPR